MGEKMFSNLFQSGGFVAQFLSQNWSSDWHFLRALSRDSLALNPGRGERDLEPPPPPGRQTFLSPPQREAQFDVSTHPRRAGTSLLEGKLVQGAHNLHQLAIRNPCAMR